MNKNIRLRPAINGNFFRFSIDKSFVISYNSSVSLYTEKFRIPYFHFQGGNFMKKALSLLLSVLMIFSCMTVAVFAEDAAPDAPVYYTIRFVDWDWDGSDETVLSSAPYSPGEVVTAPANPTRKSDDKKIEYIFKGWSADGGKTIYHAGTIPIATEDVTYMAVYAENKKSDTLTFWQLVQSIFARINKIFEYFNEIFGRDNPYF